MLGRLGEVVRTHVPANTPVAVVSDGDKAFVEIEGANALHFPSAEDGGHAGRLPADGAEAVELVELLRRRDVQYLTLPSQAFWWLERYPELNQHLIKRYQLLASEDACLLYRLVEQPRQATGQGGHPAADPRLLQPIRDLLDHLLPARTAVAVMTLGEAAPLPGVQAWQFPRAAREDLGLAAGHLAALEAGGVEFLVVARPEREWLELHPGLLDYLRTHHRLTTSQEHLCDVYELSAPVSNDPVPDRPEETAQQPSPARRTPVTRLLDRALRPGTDGNDR